MDDRDVREVALEGVRFGDANLSRATGAGRTVRVTAGIVDTGCCSPSVSECGFPPVKLTTVLPESALVSGLGVDSACVPGGEEIIVQSLFPDFS